MCGGGPGSEVKENWWRVIWNDVECRLCACLSIGRDWNSRAFPFRSVPFCSSSRVHNIMRPCMCSVGSMTLGYVDYILRVVEQAGNIRLSFTHSDWTWRFGWSYTLGTMHRNQCLSHVIRRKHYSSQHYSLESLFIITIIIENTDIVHSILTIQTDIVHYSYLASLSSYFPSCFPRR